MGDDEDSRDLADRVDDVLEAERELFDALAE
jgi:hypothetical protein